MGATLIDMRKKKTKGINLAQLLAPRNAHWLLIVGIALLYVLLPTIFSILYVNDPYLNKLALLALLAISGMLVGSRILRGDDSLSAKNSSLAPIKRANNWFVLINLGIFSLIYIVLIVTADSIPIISALMGADAISLSDERGAFLKQRSGILEIMIYVFSIYVSSVIPFCVVLLFEIRSKLRVPVALFIGWVSISFLVKSMFLNLAIPLLVYAAVRREITNRAFMTTSLALVIGLMGMIGLAGYNEESNSSGPLDVESYLSTAYGANSSIDFLVWRAVVIPLVSSRDTLAVHEQQFSGRLLGGATSGTIATLTGVDRVNMERLVFEHQYGGWSDIGNTNATFIVDAFINFGYLGVFFYGVLASISIKTLSLSKSLAMASMAPLLAFFLIGTSLVGAVLSNGFFVLFGWIAYRKFIKPIEKNYVLKTSN